MTALILIAAVLLLPQEKNEAEELFKKMEEKVAKAKSIQLSCSGTAKMSQGDMSLSADLLVETGNKVRLTCELKGPGETHKELFVSDGKAMKLLEGERVQSEKTPKALNADLILGLTRGGGLFTAGWVQAVTLKDERHANRSKVPTCSGFKMGRKEKIGERGAQSIEFTIKGMEAGDVACVLWIDTETHLPLKREIRGFHGEEEGTFVETYSDFKLDEKIDPAKFELPKEK